MGIYGALFTYPAGSDSESHLKTTINIYTNLTLRNFLDESILILTFQSKVAEDLYLHTLQFVASSIGLPTAVHFFAGLVLGNIVSKTVLLLIDFSRLESKSFHSILFISILLTIHGFFPLNAIRNGTGMWLVLYASFSFFTKRKYKYLILLLLTTQVHFGYALMIIPVVMVLLMYRKKIIILILFASSFIASFSQFDFKNYLPNNNVVQRKEGYIKNDESLLKLKDEREDVDAKAKSFITQGPKFFMYGILIMLSLYIPVYLKSSSNEFGFLFGSAYMLYAFSNLFELIPSLLGRLLNISSIFTIAALIFYWSQDYYKNNQSALRYLKIINIGFCILCTQYLFKNILHFLDTAEVFFISFPIGALFTSDIISIREVLKIIIK